MEKINVGIAGGAGYTGGELIRLLINHPHVNISFIHSKSNNGNPVSHIHSDLVGETDLVFTNELSDDIEVLFLCVGHGEAKKFLEENKIPKQIRIIDLSQDFRLKKSSAFDDRKFVYGLPELYREEIRSAKNIANPGCFATSIQLGLLPLAKEGVLKNIYTTGITGSTGAGQGFSGSSHFSWRANNIQAYKTLSHQHIKEIAESLGHLQKEFSSDHKPDSEKLNFIPWRGDFTRGIFISSQMDCSLEQHELDKLFHDFYDGHPFVTVSKEPIYLKQVVNTNKCNIQVEKVGTKVVVHSILDNLLKGASGQALQNMNLMFGLEETEGLKLKANAF
jgi:N-acetyl-gamma-glutamyl-phosphate reductase